MNLFSELMTLVGIKGIKMGGTNVKGVYAWAVIEGPISVSDMCECGKDDCELLNDPTHMIVVRCSVEGSADMFDEEFFLDDFNAAYKMKNEIQLSAGPMLIGETYE